MPAERVSALPQFAQIASKGKSGTANSQSQRCPLLLRTPLMPLIPWIGAPPHELVLYPSWKLPNTVVSIAICYLVRCLNFVASLGRYMNSMLCVKPSRKYPMSDVIIIHQWWMRKNAILASCSGDTSLILTSQTWKHVKETTDISSFRIQVMRQMLPPAQCCILRYCKAR